MGLLLMVSCVFSLYTLVMQSIKGTSLDTIDARLRIGLLYAFFFYLTKFLWQFHEQSSKLIGGQPRTFCE